MIKNQTDFLGLNTRTSDLKKDPNYCTVMDNLELNDNGYLSSIKGYGNLGSTNSAGFIQFMEHYNQTADRSELIGVKSDSIYRYDSTTNDWIKILSPTLWGDSNGTDFGFTEPLSYESYDGRLYMTDPSGVLPPLKYDGEFITLMGAPPLVIASQTTVAGSYYVLVFARHGDQTGLGDVFSDYWLFNNVASITSATFFTPFGLYSTLSNDRYKYFQDPQRPTSSGSTTLAIYASTSPLYGFRFIKSAIQPMQNHPTPDETLAITVTAGEITTAINAAPLDAPYLADIYDVASTKRMPPKTAKYITNHNGIMTLGNYTDTTSSSSPNNLENYNNSVIWSDTSTGGSVENFPALNSDTFGKEDFGLTGMFSESDNLVVFKQKQVFYMSGSLYDFNYRVRDAQAEGLGAISHRSIFSIQGAGVYMTDKGLYLTANGSKPVEFTDMIEDLFRDSNLQLTKTVTILDRLNEKVQFFVPANDGNNKIFQFDLYHKVWSTKSGIDATGGIINFQDTIYFSDGTDVYTFNTGYSFDGSPITTTFSSVWLLEGDATLKKKFTYLTLLSMYSGAIPVSLSVDADWSGLTSTPITKTLSGVDTQFPIAPNNCKGLKYTLTGETTDSQLIISGINYEVTSPQTRFKGSADAVP